jgi:hypothetical protein
MSRTHGSWGKHPKVPDFHGFPRLPQELDRRKKLMDYEIEQMRSEKGKLTIAQLAERYGVCQTTVKYYIYPLCRLRTAYRDKVRHKRRATTEPEKVERLKRKSRDYCRRVYPAQVHYDAFLKRRKRREVSKK